jgi:hypothetical protein
VSDQRTARAIKRTVLAVRALDGAAQDLRLAGAEHDPAAHRLDAAAEQIEGVAVELASADT